LVTTPVQVFDMIARNCFEPLHESTARAWIDAAACYASAAVPPKMTGRGLVICAGGMKYFPPAWVTINMLRHLGCDLPIQVWHLGPSEMTSAMRRFLEPLGAVPVDGRLLLPSFPHKRLNGWELKCYSLIHSPWSEVILLDADCVPVADPELLFSEPIFRESGALFWPDIGPTSANHPIWELTGIPHRPEPEFESGQIVLDKSRCWQPLLLAEWFNQESAFWYRIIHGDKDTFRFAWHKMNRSFGMVPHPLKEFHGTRYQHSPNGQPIFQHGMRAKWRYPSSDNLDKRTPEYQHYDLCLSFMKQLDGHLETVR
jgi:hypothetical protein